MRQQQGAALILALAVVVVVVLVASSIGSDFLVAFRRVENQLLGKQASAYMRGAEGLARQVLNQDFHTAKEKDHISEQWLNSAQQYPLDQGVISGTLCDLQGRFNVNNLPGKPPAVGTYTADQQLFIRLLQTLDLESPLDQTQAEDITQAVTDWIDSDNNLAGINSAEQDYYAERELPYRPANQYLHSVSELLWVKGVSAELFRALEPHITALRANSLLNLNTAGLNVLRSINEAGVLEPIAEADAQQIIIDRDGESNATIKEINSGFDTVSEFISAHPAGSLDAGRFRLNSDYFLLQSATIFMDREFRQNSVLFRDADGNVKTIARGHRGLGRCNNPRPSV